MLEGGDEMAKEHVASQEFVEKVDLKSNGGTSEDGRRRKLCFRKCGDPQALTPLAQCRQVLVRKDLALAPE